MKLDFFKELGCSIIGLTMITKGMVKILDLIFVFVDWKVHALDATTVMPK